MYRTLVDAETLFQALKKDASSWLLLDCRFNLADPQAGLTAYSDGHLPGAFFLDLERHLSSPVTEQSGRHPLPDPAQLSTILNAFGMTPEHQVLVYDDCGGAMAARAWWLLRWLGHDAVAVLDGGLDAWESIGGELSRVMPVTDASEQPPLQSKPGMALTVSELISELEGQQCALIDARAAERFRGEVEPIDPVAGHIPGALNRPLTDNLTQGRFKSATQLREEWLALLGDIQPEQVVHMCGSGVTACHNLLSMEYAGLSGSRLYPGSWSEWIRDSERPVALG
ncbi:sulfurtransferase [Neptuniibacter sp. CAU 1671]|uniref:sulfurtransferase n=1 Tax=Neptuniibacter sp. CAU 1671 TaxID=3032593 RepID=UPI0023DCD672|nr:sulfurtransferase [Neptuniibacter sp. CAU 1671]MDF2181578.1 sulfurtransferase [Neptuniibacter sp. CAU 1671]